MVAIIDGEIPNPMFFKTFFNHETLPVAPSPSALRVSQRNPPCWNGTQAPHHGFPWTTCEIMPNFLYISKLDLTINWVLHSDNKSPARSLKRWVFHGFFHEFSNSSINSYPSGHIKNHWILHGFRPGFEELGDGSAEPTQWTNQSPVRKHNIECI